MRAAFCMDFTETNVVAMKSSKSFFLAFGVLAIESPAKTTYKDSGVAGESAASPGLVALGRAVSKSKES